VSANGGEVSDRTRELRDEEQQHLADEALRTALRLCLERRETLDALAYALLRNEVLERADIERIMALDATGERGRGAELRVVASGPPPASA